VLGLRQEHDLSTLLRVAGLSRSTFYYHVKAILAGDRHAGLKKRIRAIFDRHRGRYGYRRIAAELRRNGEQINHKKVQRLMQAMGLKSLVRPKRYVSYRGQANVAVPNVLQRGFDAAQPNQKWVTDVTEFNVAGKRLYLSPVMDLYNGEIVAYHMDLRPDFGLVAKMLQKAVSKRSGEGTIILHSDQGWHYQMPAYRRALDAHDIKPSMSRRGNCLDNAAMESFFAVLKSELFHLREFSTIEELKIGIREYIHYYNHHRIKTKLNGLSPVKYRLSMDPAQASRVDRRLRRIAACPSWGGARAGHGSLRPVFSGRRTNSDRKSVPRIASAALRASSDEARAQSPARAAGPQ
jgi:putative transposase